MLGVRLQDLIHAKYYLANQSRLVQQLPNVINALLLNFVAAVSIV